MKFGKKLLRCVRGFTSFLRFAFWGFPRCQAGFILADLSASTSCFFNFQNFENHMGILITFASKAANCDYRRRILSKSATLSIRYKILIVVQGFSSVPFKTYCIFMVFTNIVIISWGFSHILQDESCSHHHDRHHCRKSSDDRTRILIKSWMGGQDESC